MDTYKSFAITDFVHYLTSHADVNHLNHLMKTEFVESLGWMSPRNPAEITCAKVIKVININQLLSGVFMSKFKHTLHIHLGFSNFWGRFFKKTE